MKTDDLASQPFEEDEDLCLSADVQAAVDTVPGLRTLEQWQSIALHLESELVRHSTAMAKIADQTCRLADETMARALAAERKNNTYQAALKELDGLFASGRIEISRRPSLSDGKRVGWAEAVDLAAERIVCSVSTPAGREAYRRLTLRKVEHPALKRSTAKLPYQKGELARRFACKLSLPTGIQAGKPTQGRGRPRREDNFADLLLNLIERKFPDIHETRGLAKVVRNFVKTTAEKAAAAGEIAPLRSDKLKHEQSCLLQQVRDAKKRRSRE